MSKINRYIGIRYFYVFILLILVISSARDILAQDISLRIHFIDVGEGDSILIETSQGKTVLIDTGNLITGFRVVEYLKKKNIQRLDYLILTHPHPDHIGGVFFVLQMIDVNKIYDNGQDISGLVKTVDMFRWYEDLVRNDARYSILCSGDRISLGDILLDVLWPPQEKDTLLDFNANSLVIMLRCKSFRCLLPGDLTTPGERRLLDAGIDLRADVLKIAHHGANDATSQRFLTAVSPEIAIISVDSGNIRGYPTKQTLDRIEKSTGGLYRTDIEGDILLSVLKPERGTAGIIINTSK